MSTSLTVSLSLLCVAWVKALSLLTCKGVDSVLSYFFMPMHVFDGPAQKRPLLPPLRFNCVGGCMGLNPGQLLRLWNCQSDALSTRVDLIHKSEAISNVGKEVNEI
jgi:hypothetical protein